MVGPQLNLWTFNLCDLHVVRLRFPEARGASCRGYWWRRSWDVERKGTHRLKSPIDDLQRTVPRNSGEGCTRLVALSRLPFSPGSSSRIHPKRRTRAE